ncbi:hypothetical protein DPEC_G00033180 [Dallia pectoralis]|uniref:Uncharacterized protein n=1 Tax=Dallia pectoralis TaxID=75939 RepID=A0ACC2HCQ5_DALPE|nr:hypothetical protein DPEC_G00033180 [Dallia pectoralis]
MTLMRDHTVYKSSTVKDIIPLGSPRLKQSPAPSSLQEAPIKTFEPPRRLSDPKLVLPMDQLGAESRSHPSGVHRGDLNSDARPRSHLSGIHRRGSGSEGDARPRTHLSEVHRRDSGSGSEARTHLSGAHRRGSGSESDARPRTHLSEVHRRDTGSGSEARTHLSGAHRRGYGSESDARPRTHLSEVHRRDSGSGSEARTHLSGVHRRDSRSDSDARPRTHLSGVHRRDSGSESDARPRTHLPEVHRRDSGSESETRTHLPGLHKRDSGSDSDARPRSHLPGLHRRYSGSESDSMPRPRSHSSAVHQNISGDGFEITHTPISNPPNSSWMHHRTSEGGVKSDAKASPQPHPPHPSVMLHRTSVGGVKSDAKASPQPHPPHPSVVLHRTPVGGVKSDAKPCSANLSNTHNGTMQPSIRPQPSFHSPVSPNSCKVTSFHPRNRVDYGEVSGEQMNRDLKVGTSRPPLIGAPPSRFSLPTTPTSRSKQNSGSTPGNMDPLSPGSHDISQKPSPSLHSTSRCITAGDERQTMRNGDQISPMMPCPVTPLQSQGFRDHGANHPSRKQDTPARSGSLSLKKRRRPDSREDEASNKRVCPGDYTSSTYGTTSLKTSSDPSKSHLNTSPVRLKDRRSFMKAAGMETGVSAVPNSPVATPKPPRQPSISEGEKLCIISTRKLGIPQSVEGETVPRLTIKTPAQNLNRGEGRQKESTGNKGTCHRDKETPRPMSRPRTDSGKVLSCRATTTLRDPQLFSAYVMLESCLPALSNQETTSDASVSSSVTLSPSKKTSRTIECPSGLMLSSAIPKVRHVVDESVKAGAGPSSTGFVFRRDENANLNTDSSNRTTTRFNSGFLSTEVADLSTSLHSPLPCPSPTSAFGRQGKDEKGKGGPRKFRKSLSFLSEDHLDVELGLGDLSLSQAFELCQTSSSSEEDQLPSLQQILDRTARPPDTPVKGAYPSPNTPVGPRCHSQPPEYKTKATSYRNTLDEMLKENQNIQRSKDLQAKLRLACEENLLRLAEEEEKSLDEAISHEHKEFLQRFSVVSGAIRDLHPGETVFSLENFGRLFNQHTLQLRNCNVPPQNTSQKTLLCSTPDQFSSHVSFGLFQRAYRSSPCPPQVSLWLFQMMSVHSDLLTCRHILKALTDVALYAAEHIIMKKRMGFEVWVPSVADISLVFMNMGVPFITLFPLEDVQPRFTEGDLIEGIEIGTNSSSIKEQLCTFPEHNLESVIEYLCLCTSLCPRAYSDGDLLLLLTVMSKVGLETQLSLQPKDHLHSLLHNLVNSIKDLDDMLPRICRSLVDLTEDHHNLRWLVQLLPDNMRGKRLRRHFSMSAISKLLDNRCTYTPSNTEFKLSDLRQYLPRMRPSLLVQGLAKTHNPQIVKDEEEEDTASLDQQAYYLCYSLLSLANEATIFEFFPPKQKRQLLLLSAELEKHIKCDIRESEKMLYRSKVKDFVARIYTKWQVIVHRTRPLQGKLYEYWQPLPEDTVSCIQESHHSIKEREEMFIGVNGEEEEEEDEDKGEAREGETEEKEEEEGNIIEMDLALEEEEEILGEKEDDDDDDGSMDVSLAESDE